MDQDIIYYYQTCTTCTNSKSLQYGGYQLVNYQPQLSPDLDERELLLTTVSFIQHQNPGIVYVFGVF